MYIYTNIILWNYNSSRFFWNIFLSIFFDTSIYSKDYRIWIFSRMFSGCLFLSACIKLDSHSERLLSNILLFFIEQAIVILTNIASYNVGPIRIQAGVTLVHTSQRCSITISKMQYASLKDAAWRSLKGAVCQSACTHLHQRWLKITSISFRDRNIPSPIFDAGCYFI